MIRMGSIVASESGLTWIDQLSYSNCFNLSWLKNGIFFCSFKNVDLRLKSGRVKGSLFGLGEICFEIEDSGKMRRVW